jgi:hypothetical protein
VDSRGAASVEQVGLTALVALVMLAAIAGLAAGPPVPGERELASTLARRIRCSAALAGPCWQDPLTVAYGRAVGGAVRALAPTPAPLASRSGLPLMPVDFRYCRSESCAVAGPEPAHLTVANRRVTAFTSVIDRRRSGQGVEITYWMYRPGLGWSRAIRAASSAEVQAYASTPLLEDADPRLVALETLPGRNHYDFPPGEEPPWRWLVPGHY